MFYITHKRHDFQPFQLGVDSMKATNEVFEEHFESLREAQHCLALKRHILNDIASQDYFHRIFLVKRFSHFHRFSLMMNPVLHPPLHMNTNWQHCYVSCRRLVRCRNCEQKMEEIQLSTTWLLSMTTFLKVIQQFKTLKFRCPNCPYEQIAGCVIRIKLIRVGFLVNYWSINFHQFLSL